MGKLLDLKGGFETRGCVNEWRRLCDEEARASAEAAAAAAAAAAMEAAAAKAAARAEAEVAEMSEELQRVKEELREVETHAGEAERARTVAEARMEVEVKKLITESVRRAVQAKEADEKASREISRLTEELREAKAAAAAAAAAAEHAAVAQINPPPPHEAAIPEAIESAIREEATVAAVYRTRRDVWELWELHAAAAGGAIAATDAEAIMRGLEGMEANLTSSDEAWRLSTKEAIQTWVDVYHSALVGQKEARTKAEANASARV